MTAGRRITSLSQDWGTPPKYIRAVLDVLGEIALDPCSNPASLVPATTRYLLPHHDSLKESLNFSTIFVNPPYGRNPENHTTIADWLLRCSEAHEQHGSQVLALIPVATNTRHWKENIFLRASAVCFLSDTRLRFMENGEESRKGAPMACAMVYWGSRPDRFQAVFSPFGKVFPINP